MKTNKIQMVAAVVVASILSLTLFAQDKEILKFDVNGLYITTVKCTKAQIVAALGEPVRYMPKLDEYNDYAETYEYANSYFNFRNNGELVTFYIEDPQFKCFDGRVKIGSPLSVVENLPGCRFELMSHNVINMVTYSKLWTGHSERAVNIGHKNGVIVSIGYSDPM